MIDSLLSKFSLPIIVGLVIALIGGAAFHFIKVGLLESSLATSQEKVGKLTSENATLRAANKDMADKIDVQNREIARLKDSARIASDQAEKDLAKVRAESQKWRTRYNEILNAPTPTGDSCKAASDTLSRYRVIRDAEKEESR